VNCCVTNIHLAEDGVTVKSVEVARMPSKPDAPAPAPSERWTVNVKKEAILSAGSIHTPQILMLSGIGPKDELEKIGIKPVKEVDAVGKNLIDVSLSGSPLCHLNGFLASHDGALLPSCSKYYAWLSRQASWWNHSTCQMADEGSGYLFCNCRPVRRVRQDER
jgi:choline dehydrogenase-like flavoprotein